MKPDILTADEQRAHATRLTLAAAYLELTLRDQLRRALAGDFDALQQFQQDVQYAPPGMRENILKFLADERAV